MKKILALITAFFMSLSTSTDYTVVEDKPYTNNTYTIDETEMPNYRAYFNGGEGASSTSGCQPICFNSYGQIVDGSGNGYWFIDGEHPVVEDKKIFAPQYLYDDKGVQTSKKDKVKAQYKSSNGDNEAATLPGMFRDDKYIIAPFRCTLQTRSTSGGVTSMLLYCNVGATSYAIKISAMKCWYCDVNRTGDFVFHTCDEQFGKSFSGGNVLGKATRNTTILIYPIDSTGNKIGTCSMYQFYKGKYTKYKKES